MLLSLNVIFEQEKEKGQWSDFIDPCETAL